MSTSSLATTEPLAWRSLVATAVTVAAGIAAAVGITVTDTDQATITAGITGAVAAVGVIAHLVAAWRARRKVTPTANPRDDDGLPLMTAAAAGTLDAGAPPDIPPGPDGQPPTVPPQTAAAG